LVTIGVNVTGVLQIYQLRIVENLQQKYLLESTFEFAYRVRIKMEQLFFKGICSELIFDIVPFKRAIKRILSDFTASLSILA
jgi:hypothetical protein